MENEATGVITNNKALADAQTGTGNNQVANAVADSNVLSQNDWLNKMGYGPGAFLNKPYLNI